MSPHPTGGTAHVTSADHPVSCTDPSESKTKVNAPLGSEDVKESPIDNILPGSPACPPSPLSSPHSVCANTGKVVSGPSYTVRKSQHPPLGPPTSIST